MNFDESGSAVGIYWKSSMTVIIIFWTLYTVIDMNVYESVWMCTILISVKTHSKSRLNSLDKFL